ncbi:hypothetical protein NCAS_0A03450 [Naumovozyma castellii]|uniref:Uncharacterized protein n=1 Tax=Naumovozyma castellii TaxID=27288 RepID=G0V613_NAUCA|nr:hypothetical protein NCAS_0A03450 [Naumovozyma castellii CBS 4309]CCC66903.1 hypothetical protein NCAS_0A03450 [Naumovozyma castellii CBS 4309]
MSDTEHVDTGDAASALIAGTESDSDDFGNFSDASFTHDEEATDQEVFVQCLEEAFGTGRSTEGLPPLATDTTEYRLEQLIQDERPHVIYQQLVEYRTALQPIIWNKSHIRSRLYQILRISEENDKEKQQQLEEEEKLKRAQLDDALFNKIMKTLVNTKSVENTISQHQLKDTFKINYTPSLGHLSLQDEEKQDLENSIPSLIKTNPSSKNNENTLELQEYHDQLCNSIDLLIERLRKLKQNQRDLEKDKTTFENVITNLTGHTQRLQRDEIALYNKKKQKQKRKMFSWTTSR